MPAFKGHDYQELADWWGIEPGDDFLDDRIVIDEMREYIWDALNEEESELDADVKKDMMDFLAALYWSAQKLCYQAPIWKAIWEIGEKDDFTFVQMFDLLLPQMWT